MVLICAVKRSPRAQFELLDLELSFAGKNKKLLVGRVTHTTMPMCAITNLSSWTLDQVNGNVF